VKNVGMKGGVKSGLSLLYQAKNKAKNQDLIDVGKSEQGGTKAKALKPCGNHNALIGRYMLSVESPPAT